MHALSEQGIIHIWEGGLGSHSLDLALIILATAFPGVPYEQLTHLSIGQRDGYMFALRERTFGSQLTSFVICPSCREQLELVLDIAQLPIPHSVTHIQPEQFVQQTTFEGYELQYCLPNSLDLAAIATSGDVTIARTLLLQRCVLQASLDGLTVAVEELPETVVTALTTQMDASDPLATLDISLDCSVCGYRVQVLFDIVSFFWSEIAAQAKRLLREVHTLARAYGWREADILSMSTARRQLYLEMVT